MDVFDLFAKISLDDSEFRTGLDSAGKQFKSFSKSLDSGLSGAKDLFKPAVEGFKAVESVGKTTGQGISNALKVFGAASAAVGGFGTTAVKSGMNFDATMSEVSAISGATGKDFDSLRDKALEMGAKTKFSASEAAEAMTYMGMAGWKAGDMVSGIEGIMNLAAASGEDLATTSDIVTDALTAFGLQAGDSGHFANVMAVAASNANTNVGMMGETFKYVAPVAGALGYSVDDTALAIGLMANSGIKATNAGTALRSIFTRLSTDAGASSQSLGALGVLTEKLGVEFYNADGSARALNDVLVDSRAAWSGLSEEQQITYAKTIAGQEAMSGWLALMNAAPSDVEKLTSALGDCNGAAEEMANTMIDNLQGDLTLLGSAFESLQIAISDGLTPTLREFAQFGQKAMSNLLEGFQNSGVSGFMDALSGVVTNAVTFLSEKAPEFVAVSGQFIAALVEGVLNSRTQIMTAANDILIMFREGLGTWLSQNSQELIAFGNELLRILFQGFLTAGDIISENIGQFIPLLTDAFMAYHEALFTVGLDILAAIGEGIIENKDKIQSIASSTIESMVTSLRENAPDIIDGGIALLEALAGAIVENLPLILETGAEIVTKLAESISEALPELIPAAVEAILKFVEGLTSPDSSSNLIGGALKVIEGLIEGLVKAVPLLIEYAPEIVVNLVTGIIGAIPKLLEVGAMLIKGLIEGLIKGIVAIPEAIAKVVKAIIDGFKELFGIHSPSTVFSDMGLNLIAGLLEGISAAWESILEFFSGAAEGLIQFLGETWETIKTAASDTWEGIKTVVSDAWDAISTVWEGASEFFSDIWGTISDLFGGAKEFFSNAFSGAWEAITDVWDGAGEFFGDIWETITGVFSDVWEKFKEIGGDIVQGIWDGVSGAWSSFWNWLSGKVGGIIDGVKGMLGIHSPSTVFAGIGENMALGLGEGWGNEYNAVKRQIEGGLNFRTATVDLSSNGLPRESYDVPASMRGGDTFNFYSPKALDPVSAAREMKKAKQQMALGYVGG